MGSTYTIPPPIEEQLKANRGTHAGVTRKLVHAAGFCVYVVALVALMRIPAVRPWHLVIYRGQVALVIGYVWIMTRLRVRIHRMARNGKYQTALRLDRFWSLWPLYGASLKGIILFDQGRYREAQAFLRPLAFDAQGNPKLGSMELYCYAIALVNDDRAAEAEPLLDAAVKASPEKDSYAVALAGCLLTEGKDPDRARALLEEIISRSSQRGVPRSDRANRIARYAWALAACGRRSEAQQQIDAALAAGQGLGPGDLAGVYYFVGETWRTLQEGRKARDAYAKAVQLRPEGVIAVSVQKALAKLDASQR